LGTVGTHHGAGVTGTVAVGKDQTPDQILAAILDALPELGAHHAPHGKAYKALAAAARGVVASLFGRDRQGAVPFGSFGSLTFPYRSMGAVDSLDLFGLDELIIFAFYWANRQRYRKVADIGANIGLHSIMLSRCGFAVTSYEPDPEHVAILSANLAANAAANVEIVASAVSDRAGSAEFLRLRGNTTGSHLAGAKSNPYGEIDKFPVTLVPFSEIAARVDLAKIDAEGHEVTILSSLDAAQWNSLDVMLEIGTAENAAAIYDYSVKAGINIFTQKTGWRRAATPGDLPVSYKQGSAFMTRKNVMPGFDAE